VSSTSRTVQPLPLDGDTLTQGAVTATIKRVMWQSGSWSGHGCGPVRGDATPPGGISRPATATTTSGAVVTLSGPQSAITLAPGGHFEFVKANFSGQLVTRRIYGCDGVNQCFEFDGTTLAPIATGPVAQTSRRTSASTRTTSSSAKAASIIGLRRRNAVQVGVGRRRLGNRDRRHRHLHADAARRSVLARRSASTCAAISSILYGSDPTSFNYVSVQHRT
jgi:hypothetical protein